MNDLDKNKMRQSIVLDLINWYYTEITRVEDVIQTDEYNGLDGMQKPFFN